MYFRITPFSLRGGSQDTKTMEAEAAAALTPAGGPGTGRAGRVVTHGASMRRSGRLCLSPLPPAPAGPRSTQNPYDEAS